MMPSGTNYQRMQQNYRQSNHPDRFQYLQQCKPIPTVRPTNMGHELLTKLEQAGKVPSREKFRRMCCQTFLSTGGCPYNDRCVFLHDPRLHIESFRLRTVKNVRQSGILKDTFYWPDMERGDVSLLLDAQGLPDAKQAYTIPKDFSQVPPSSHHDRALYSMWNHFIDACLEGSYPQGSNINKAFIMSPPMTMSGASATRPINPATNRSGAGTYGLNSAYSNQNCNSHMSSPQSVATAMFSPQGISGNFSTPGTPGKPLSCRLMAMADIRGQSDNMGMNRDLNYEFGLASNSQKDLGHVLGMPSWDQRDQREIDMEPYRNKHLKGVWRLPMFISLAEGSGQGAYSPLSSASIDIKYAPGPDPLMAPLPSPDIRPAATQASGRMQASLPPASYLHHSRDCQLNDLNGHHDHHLHQEYGDRALYSDALKATTHPAAMTRSTPGDSSNNHFMHSYSPLSGSNDSDLSHFMMQQSQSQGDQSYNGNHAFSYEHGNPYKAVTVENVHYDRQVGSGMKGDGNHMFSGLDGILSQQRRQRYNDEPTGRDINQGYQIPPRDFHPPHLLSAFEPKSPQQYPPYGGFLSQQGREASQFSANVEHEQPRPTDEAQQLRLRIPGWQMDEQGQGQGEKPFDFRPQYDHFAQSNQNDPSSESKCGAAVSKLTISTPNRTGVVDRWNGGQSLDMKKEGEFGSRGNPSPLADITSPATSWESINSAFSRDPGSQFSPSTESYQSDMSDFADSEWKPFGDLLATTPVKPTLVSSKRVFQEDFEVSSESDDIEALKASSVPVTVGTIAKKDVNVEKRWDDEKNNNNIDEEGEMGSNDEQKEEKGYDSFCDEVPSAYLFPPLEEGSAVE